MADGQNLEQPWKEWYAAKDISTKVTHYVVPVMAAGNRAPAFRKNERLDLSRPKPKGTKKA